MVRRWLSAMLALGLAAAAIAGDVRKEFRQIWIDRQAGYEAHQPALQEQAKATATTFLTGYQSNADNLYPMLVTALTAAQDLSENTARRNVLVELEAMMVKKPSPAAAQAWVQGKYDAIRSQAQAAQAELAHLQGVKIGTDMPVGDWIAAKERLAQAMGDVFGQSKEVVLIDQNLQLFYNQLGIQQQQAREARARFAAALGAMGQSMSAASAQAAANAPRSFNMNCTTMGGFTNCNGSH